MNPQEKQHLTRIVERIAVLNAQVQEAKWEIKELADSCWDKAAVKGKVAKLLAKESAWDAIRREEQRQLEESLDECRAALGMLADLPLGQAAAHSVTNPMVKANGSGEGEPRKRGRPKGSRNKPKAESRPEDWTRPAQAGSPPNVPDFPEVEF